MEMSHWGRERAKIWRKRLGIGVVTILIVHVTLSALLFMSMRQPEILCELVF
jgi:hypothetical protein